MSMSWSLSPRSLAAGGGLTLWLVAGDAAIPEPHWSGLPIWGAEASARGHQIPRPFGIGITAWSSRQPVDIQDLQLGRNESPPVSVKNFLQIDQADSSQQNVSAKLDVLVFPFLDVYAILGYTRRSTKGLIEVPGDSDGPGMGDVPLIAGAVQLATAGAQMPASTSLREPTTSMVGKR